MEGILSKKVFKASKALILCAMFLCASLNIEEAVAAKGDNFNIIANGGMDVKALTQRQIYTMFTGRKNAWPDGTPIEVVIYNYSTKQSRDFCLGVLDIPFRKFRLMWNRAIFSGSRKGAILVSDEEEMLQVVKATPGAIGYVINSDVSLDEAFDGGDINVLQIK